MRTLVQSLGSVLVLIIEQDAVINFTLKPAAVAEAVTVTGESPIVDTTKSDVSTSVSTQQIQDLPVASRRWIDLAMLTPGTSQDNIRGFFYRGNVNVGAGGREYSNGFVVDGVNNTWAEMGEPRQNFAMDALQEFKVSTSTYKAKRDHQRAQGQSLFFRYGAEAEYRPIITAGGTTAVSNSFDFAVPRKSAVVGHTWVISPRALNDARFQYAYAKYEVAPPYSHGDWEPADFTARLPLCTPVFNYPSISVGGCGNAQMGPESRWQVKDDFSYLMHAWGGSHQWKMGVDFSSIPFEGDNTGSPLGNWTFPKDAPYNVNDPTTYPTQYTNSLPTYANIPTKTFAGYIQDDWQARSGLTFNLGVRYDLQKGSFNE